MNEKVYIGIDPGKDGGIAVLDADGNVVECVKTPPTFKDLLDMVSRHKESSKCVCEKVHAMPGQGVTSMFSFGRTVGGLEMMLLALGIPTEYVAPQKWQKHFSLGSSKGKSKTEWKNILKAKAQQMFPRTKVTLYNADALLLAEYARQKNI